MDVNVSMLGIEYSKGNWYRTIEKSLEKMENQKVTLESKK